jgi:crotonobetainyl-CoA:carnitine CoA-transferase CaiB-like acyl-CoA transferase
MVPDAALTDLWRHLGGDPAALGHVALTGAEPALPSSFAIGTAARATIAANGLAAAELWAARTGRRQRVAVDMRHAVIEFRSERYLRINGAAPASLWDSLAGLYAVADGHVRLHTNFPHHRDAITRLLGCAPERETVAAALAGWTAEAFETAANAAGGVVAALRRPDEWAAACHC